MSTTSQPNVVLQSLPQQSPTATSSNVVVQQPIPAASSNVVKSIPQLSPTAAAVNNNNNFAVNNEKVVYSRWARFRQAYVMYINPWIRLLIFIAAILILYALSSSYLTWRENVFIDFIETMLPQYNIGNPFRLPDVMHNALPEVLGTTEIHWQGFADATAGIWSCLFLAICLVRRDFVRLSEYVVIQIYMFAFNALAHIVTTYPDAHGMQMNCEGNSNFRILITVQYCGDMMWSGHTANTLIPVIMLRRILFDWVGWNWYDHVRTPLSVVSNGHWVGYHVGSPLTLYHYKLVADFFKLHTITRTAIVGHDHGIVSYDDGHIINKVNPTEVAAIESHSHPNDPRLNPNHVHHNSIQPEPAVGTVKQDNVEAIEMEQLKPSYMNTTIVENNAVTTTAAATSEPASTVTTVPTFTDAPVVTTAGGIPPNGDRHLHQNTNTDNVEWRDANGNLVTSNGPSQSLPLTAAQQQQVQAETGLLVAPLDVLQHDKFFRPFRCPYVSPAIVANNGFATMIILTIIRLILFAWCTMLMFALLLVRYHYTADIVVSVFISCFLCHSQLIQVSVRWFYRPNYNNYAFDSWYMPCYIERPLNEEQVNYEERMTLVGAYALI